MKRLRIICFGIFFALAFVVNAAYAKVVFKSSSLLSFYLFTPSDYNLKQKYPLIIVFHWSYGKGSDMIERWKEQGEKKKYLIACPNSSRSGSWDTAEDGNILRMIDSLKKHYNIDESRIYLVGFSAGAVFTYYLGLSNPDKFRAIAAFAGSFKCLKSVPLSKDSEKHIPVLILHGSRDNVVDISESEYAQQQLKDYGYQVKFIELKGEKHNYPAYVSWAIINWFEKLEKQKD